MLRTGSFRRQINILGIAAAVLTAAALFASFLFVRDYNRLSEQLRAIEIPVVQRFLSVLEELGEVQKRVNRLVTDPSIGGSEQLIYLRGGQILDSIDSQIARLSSAEAGTAEQVVVLDHLRDYRNSVAMVIEMLSVNPRLAEKMSLRAASSLSELNSAMASNFKLARRNLEISVQVNREAAEREIRFIMLGIGLLGVAVMALIIVITRRLARNIDTMSVALKKLGAGQTELELPAGTGEGEFLELVQSIHKFRDALLERNFAHSQADAIFESIVEGVVLVDSAGLVARANPAAEKLFGYPTGGLRGVPVAGIVPGRRAPGADAAEPWRVTGLAISSLEGVRRDGSSVQIRAEFSPLSLGNLHFEVGVITDITPVIEHERALREARDHALESARAKSDFLATMSHEIRTPMNGIIGMAQLLSLDDVDEARRAECVRILLGSSRTLLTLLNDILDLAKVDSGKLDLLPQPASPTSLAAETCALFKELAGAKDLRLVLSPTLPATEGYLLDPLRVRQMLSNLLGNAIKFTSSGSVTVGVQTMAGARGTTNLLFSVTDTGPGISPQHVGGLFESYSQAGTAEERGSGGTGLGLSIVRRFARAMGGEAGVSSRLGEGSLFWFRIQAVKVAGWVPALPGGTAALPTGAPDECPFGTGRSVLIAEDVPASRKFLQLALDGLGLESHVVATGVEAVELVTAGRHFDCVLMDVRMPELDGDQATRQIRRWEADNAHGTHCPIIAVTANAYDEDRQKCFDSGMDDFIAKPVRIDELKTVLARWIPKAA